MLSSWKVSSIWLLALLVAPGLTGLGPRAAGQDAPAAKVAFDVGDTNADGDIDLSDAIHLLGWLYSGGPAPAPLDCGYDMPYSTSADVNGDASVDVSDGIYLLMWLFAGGPDPMEACNYGLGSGGHHAPAEYEITELARLGDPAPGGGEFFFDFEAGGISNHGDVAFLSDLSTGGEGMFYRDRGGKILALARPGEAAPGGGTYLGAEFAGPPVNSRGDAAFIAFLEPFQLPQGLNLGVYRFSRDTRAVTSVVIPGVTPT